MPVGFTLKLDMRAAELAIAAVRKGVPRAATRAINRTLTTVRVDAAKQVAADIGIPPAAARKAMEIVKARFTNLRGLVRITGARIPLIALGARGPEPSRGKGQGVSYSLGGQRRRLPSAFITTLRSGHRGVFRRVGPSTRLSPRAWGPNLPIIELRGPSIPRVAGKAAILNALKRLGQLTLLRNFDHELKFLMATKQAPGGDE